MKTYIGVKMIKAVAMTAGVALDEGLIKRPTDGAVDFYKEGYAVDYGDYKSWSPKDVFEAAYYPIEDATKITRTDVEGFIVKGAPFKLKEKTTIVLDSTLTGFDTIASSACVDPANFDLGVGAEIARRDITDKIWGHLGFVLQWAKNGLKGNNNS